LDDGALDETGQGIVAAETNGAWGSAVLEKPDIDGDARMRCPRRHFGEAP
jgi:hypothetical protein